MDFVNYHGLHGHVECVSALVIHLLRGFILSPSALIVLFDRLANPSISLVRN